MFRDALDAEILTTEQSAKNVGNFMGDSYADGFAAGRLEALRWARDWFTGENTAGDASGRV